jgi:rhomboid protease GluP
MAFLRRQTSGSVVCPSCGRLVGVKDERCFNCGRARPGLLGFGPLLRGLTDEMGVVRLVVGACVALYLAMLLTDPAGVSLTLGFGMLSPSGNSALRFGASGVQPVLLYGRWWTILSAGWLHGGLLHIGFNMIFAWQLLPLVIRVYGAGRAVILYVVSSAVGFLLSTLAVYLPVQLPFLMPAGITLGASAANLGMLGAMVWYGRRSGSSMLGQQMLAYAVVNIVIGFGLPGIDNWAHLGGFGAGWLLARFLDPLREERGDHVVIAWVLLLLSAASVVASLVVRLPPGVG